MKYKCKIYALMLASVMLLSVPLAFATEVYFSPDGGVQEEVINEIHSAKKTIDIMMYSFTSDELANALINASERGVKIRMIMDRVQSSNKSSQDESLIKHGIQLKIEQQKGIMHNKVAIIDGAVVLTGSYNWTDNAEEQNQENMLVIDTPNIVQKYQERFDYLWRLNSEE